MGAGTIRVVIADDEPLARRRVRTLLAAHADFEAVAECVDGDGAVATIRRERPDVVFLDVQMPGLDGVHVARAIEVVPPPLIVFVTAFDEFAVQAFGVRAVDYLLKPFDEARFAAMLEHVRERLQASRSRDAHERLLAFVHSLEGGSPVRRTLQLGPIEADLAARKVRCNGEVVVLRRKEFDMLVAFMRRPGEIVTRAELLQGVFGYKDDVVSRTIDTHLAVLRRKLAPQPGQPGFIETIARVGYRMIGEAEAARPELMG